MCDWLAREFDPHTHLPLKDRGRSVGFDRLDENWAVIECCSDTCHPAYASGDIPRQPDVEQQKWKKLRYRGFPHGCHCSTNPQHPILSSGRLKMTDILAYGFK
jgi:hypothetical protein